MGTVALGRGISVVPCAWNQATVCGLFSPITIGAGPSCPPSYSRAMNSSPMIVQPWNPATAMAPAHGDRPLMRPLRDHNRHRCERQEPRNPSDRMWTIAMDEIRNLIGVR